ncbi:MAG: hypothetical protein KJP16_13235 [Gammaproteobacteria bacterium]|nr:hypothetical protein [Gammaproteobacteria bacterium]NNL51770.1 hypothetical protein [Woeseiaceae bacterium]
MVRPLRAALRAGVCRRALLGSEALVRGNGGLTWNGSAAGYRSFADYDAESGISLIMASNLTSGAIDL